MHSKASVIGCKVIIPRFLQISASIMANNNAEIWTNILHNGQIVSRVYARASDGEHDQGAHTILLKLTEGKSIRKCMW